MGHKMLNCQYKNVWNYFLRNDTTIELSKLFLHVFKSQGKKSCFRGQSDRWRTTKKSRCRTYADFLIYCVSKMDAAYTRKLETSMSRFQSNTGQGYIINVQDFELWYQTLREQPEIQFFVGNMPKIECIFPFSNWIWQHQLNI